MLMKLTPRIDFTNILHAAFTRSDSKSAKNTVKPSVIFGLLEPLHIKSTRKMLVKLTPGRQWSPIAESPRRVPSSANATSSLLFEFKSSDSSSPMFSSPSANQVWDPTFFNFSVELKKLLISL